MNGTTARRRVLYLEASTTGVVGGSTTGLQHFLQGLDRSTYEPVVVFYEDKALNAELARCGVRVRVVRKRRVTAGRHTSQEKTALRPRRMTWWRSIRRTLREGAVFLLETFPAAWLLARLYREERPHLVHLVNGFRSNLDGVVAAWLTGIPCVCHVKKFENYGWVDRLFARTVALGVCMTEAIRVHCRHQGMRPKRLEVIYDGIDMEHFRSLPDAAARIRQEWHIPPQAPVIGIVGNIRPWKGQAVVVEAVQAVRERFPELRCLIIGGVHPSGEDYMRRLQQYIEAHNLHDNVIFAGFRHDVADLIAAMDIVVHASVTPEPFGRVILEGMALGKPVIATALGGVPEFVQDGVTGMLVPANEPPALAAALRRLLEDQCLRERLGSNARHEVERRFAVRHHVAEMVAAYSKIERV